MKSNTTLGTTLSADLIDSLIIQKPQATTTRSRDLVLASMKKQSITSITCEGDMSITLENGAVQSMPVMRYVLASLGSVDRIDRLVSGHMGQQYAFADSTHLLEGTPKVVTQAHKLQSDMSESEKVLLPLADDITSLRKSLLETRIAELQSELAALSVTEKLYALVELAIQGETTFISDTAHQTTYTEKSMKKLFSEYSKAVKSEHTFRFTSELSRKGLLYAVIKAVIDDKSYPYFPKDSIDGIDENPFGTLTLALKGNFAHLETANWINWQVLGCAYMDIFSMTQLTIKPLI